VPKPQKPTSKKIKPNPSESPTARRTSHSRHRTAEIPCSTSTLHRKILNPSRNFGHAQDHPQLHQLPQLATTPERPQKHSDPRLEQRLQQDSELATGRDKKTQFKHCTTQCSRSHSRGQSLVAHSGDCKRNSRNQNDPSPARRSAQIATTKHQQTSGTSRQSRT
jgi:hypothetical protein